MGEREPLVADERLGPASASTAPGGYSYGPPVAQPDERLRDQVAVPTGTPASADPPLASLGAPARAGARAVNASERAEARSLLLNDNRLILGRSRGLGVSPAVLLTYRAPSLSVRRRLGDLSVGTVGIRRGRDYGSAAADRRGESTGRP
jgi:hypothetical protein